MHRSMSGGGAAFLSTLALAACGDRASVDTANDGGSQDTASSAIDASPNDDADAPWDALAEPEVLEDGDATLPNDVLPPRDLDDHDGGETADTSDPGPDHGESPDGTDDPDGGLAGDSADADPTDAASGVDTPDDTGPIPLLQASFRIDGTTVAPDPERGFFRWGGEITDLDAGWLDDIHASGARLAYVMIRLDDFRQSSIGAARLAAIGEGFARLRAAGLKAIVRVTYNYPSSETEYRNAADASLTRVEAHIAELGPVLDTHADVIAFIQAGFIGAWGEWHTSSNGLTEPTPRTAIRDALLAHFPQTRTISFRYPPHLLDWYPTLPTLAARLAGDAPRIGFHNDCFLASESDVGTYPNPNRDALRAHMKALGAVFPFGGETCNPADATQPTSRMTCDDILREGAEYGLTYLNRDYWQAFHDSWARGGCLDAVARAMGHRLALTSLSLPEAASSGDTIELAIGLRNDGWARMHNGRSIVLVLSRGAETHALTVMGADVRAVGRGETLSLTGAVALPAAMQAGLWAIAIALPDPGLPEDIRYATRLFNADDSTSGQRWDAPHARLETGLALTLR